MDGSDQLNLSGMTVGMVRQLVLGMSDQEQRQIIPLLRTDPRLGVQRLADSLGQKWAKAAAQEERQRSLRQHEDNLRKRGYACVAGLDEAGRGPLAGPVVAGAVVLPPYYYLPGLDDSKRLTPDQRDELFARLTAETDWAVAVMGVTQIEVHNIQWATHQAMRQALLRLRSVPDYVLVDGFPIPKLHLPQEGVIKGDQRCNCIAAASIVAKVVRDRLMVEYDGVYPQCALLATKAMRPLNI